MKNKKLDLFGIGCGAFLVLVLIVNIVAGNINAKANQPKIPASAQTYTTSAQGIFSEVTVETVADADGIYSIQVDASGETPELGGQAAEELPARMLEAQSVEVDAFAGATMTSNAIKAAVTEALVQAGFMEAPAVEEPAAEEPAAEEPAAEEPAAEEPAAEAAETAAEPEIPDGAAEAAAEPEIPEGAALYSTAAQGIFSEVKVETVADANSIYSIQVDASGETPELGGQAAEELPAKMLEAQSVEVDAFAGATMTSNAIKAAVTEALVQAGFMTAEEPAEEESLTEETVETVAAAPAEEGVYTASAPGVFGEPVVVAVEADAGTIYSVTVTENNETDGIGSVAVAELPDKIVAAQSVEIDGISGATMTSNAIKTAVAECLEAAGFVGGEPIVPEEPVAAEDVSYDVDVVVIGAGGAGMTAAITASDAGMNVLVLESQAMVGGNSVRSTGGMNAGKTEWQDANDFDQAAGVEATLAKVPNYADNARIQELAAIVSEQWAAYQENPVGYFDSVELFQLDTLIGGGGLNNPALVQTLAENSAAAIEWLGKLDPEVVLHNVAAFGGASVKRIHRPVDENGKVLSVGAYVVPLLKTNLESRGISLLLNTTATEIVLDENGAACGVIATGAHGETVTVNAGAVVIASGGFGANNEMIASIRPELDGFITTNAPGIQGQGIRMAQAVGADTVDLEQIQLHPTVHVEGTNAVLITEGLRGDGAILVNQEGQRFFDEVSTRDKVSAAEFDQTGGYAWLIVDSRMSEASNVIQGYIKNGYAETGESYEALAEAIGAPADVFAATMADWNEKVAAKEDPDFGRVSFANPLDQAPYYAIKVQPGIHHTMGGVKIDSAAEVIDTEGKVIPALFAAGEVTGGVHGNNRLGGNAVADFTIFGRIAGQSAADYVANGVELVEETVPAMAEASAEATYVPGTYSGEAQGIFSTVKVTLTVDENAITAVELDTTGETPEIGGAHDEEFAAQILANGAEIDSITGASVTSQAVRLATAQALEQAAASGAEVGAAALVADGTYTAKAPSFGVMKEMELAVTFENNAITAIETVCAGSATQADEDEYSPIYATVEAKLFPRIIESQSLAVDSITGATVSSNAAKLIIGKIIDANGGNSADWYTPIEKSDAVVTLEDYDVIVVGLGASGMSSYISAAENGATVFGLEAAAKIGGNGTNTAGPLGVNPPHQVEANNGEAFVDPDELFDAWMEYTDGDAKEEIVRLFIDESGETFAWLADNWGFQFLPSMFAFYDSHNWPLWTMYMDKDNAYNNALVTAKAMNEKNDYMTELTAKTLLTDEDGKVIGVEAEYYDGTCYRIYGDSVILASGGYIGNAEMTKKYTGAVWHTKGMTQCNGFGISEALKLGGALYNEDVAVEDHIAQLDTIIRSDDYSNDDKGILTSLVLDLNYQFIDSEGKPFDGNYNGLGIAFNAWEAGANYYVLINEAEYSAIKENGLIAFNAPMFFNQGGSYEEGTPVANLDEIMAMGQAFNDVVIADSLEELEKQLGIDIQLDDVHGQTEGKIWCIKGAAYVYSTCGGMDVDTNINLLKEDGTPVENVYVVGNESLGTLNESNKAYVTYGGCAQGWALTSGRLAGANAAAKFADNAA